MDNADVRDSDGGGASAIVNWIAKHEAELLVNILSSEYCHIFACGCKCALCFLKQFTTQQDIRKLILEFPFHDSSPYATRLTSAALKLRCRDVVPERKW
jgi:hypothetical protein